MPNAFHVYQTLLGQFAPVHQCALTDTFKEAEENVSVVLSVSTLVYLVMK